MRWFALGAVVTASGCAFVWRIDQFGPAADASVDAPVPCAAFGPWSTPTRISASDAALPDEDAALQPGGTLLVFDRQIAPGDRDLFYATRSPAGNDFEMATRIPFDMPAVDEAGPFWSPDGTKLYFSQGSSILVSAVSGTTFDTPVAAHEFDNFPTYLFRPRFSTDLLEVVYFANPVADLWHATRADPTGSSWTSYELNTISSSLVDDGPTLTTDDLTMYFSSRGDTAMKRHLFEAHRSRHDAPAFDAPATDLGDFGVAEPTSPDISRDGKLMVFSGYPNTQDDLYLMTRDCQ